jgi:hypothetical protein
MSLTVKALACVLLAVVAAGCVVEEARPPRPCPEAVWYHGFRDRGGYWHPGHWECARPREVIIVR